MSPTSKGVAITPSDATDLTGIKQIVVGGAGTLIVRLTRDPNTSLTLTVPAGFVFKGSVTRVMAASGATLLVGFY